MWLSVPLLGASGTRGFRRGVRPAQMRSSGWVMIGLYSALIGVLMDGIEWYAFSDSDFWRILLKWLNLFWCADGFDYFLSVMFIAVYLPSNYFVCAPPCCSFAEISPDVILDYGIKNRYIIVRYKTIILL